MIPHTIEVRIEELVLHGFAPKDRYAIGEAVQRELQRLFTEQGLSELPAAGYELARLNGGAFTVKPGAKAQTIGAQVAQAVYASLAGGSTSRRSLSETKRSAYQSFAPISPPTADVSAKRKEERNG